MNKEKTKQLLESKYQKYCNYSFFVETDPIQIPKQYRKKEDIEISAFLSASLAWGQRKTIINKSKELLSRMDNAPHDFIIGASEKEIQHLDGFNHRTLNDYDIKYFIRSLSNIYRNHGGLEAVFNQAWENSNHDMIKTLTEWHHIFVQEKGESRVLRHIANVNKGSAAKRVNMFLRWMVRTDREGVDFGLWKNIPSSALLIPLDVHVANTSRELGLLTRTQNDIKAVLELTEQLREFDSNDPIKYDFALFGIGAFK